MDSIPVQLVLVCGIYNATEITGLRLYFSKPDGTIVSFYHQRRI